ncbi:MAG: hypothetical protein FWG82_03475 [Oscillospiraceae bacterium]|nr:hypothetical protein [Oscillospiraceae bacterium]
MLSKKRLTIAIMSLFLIFSFIPLVFLALTFSINFLLLAAIILPIAGIVLAISVTAEKIADADKTTKLARNIAILALCIPLVLIILILVWITSGMITGEILGM